MWLKLSPHTCLTYASVGYKNRKAGHIAGSALGPSARQAAEVLRRRFGTETVFAFGSLVRGGTFDERSDVDLAVRGVPPQDFFRASAAAAAAVCEFDLDLIDLDDCSPALREQVQREGVGL